MDVSKFGSDLLRQAHRDDVLGLAAELAYRWFLALFPFLILLSAIGARLATALGVQNPTEQFVDLLGEMMPGDAAGQIGPQLEFLVGSQGSGVVSAALFFGLWAATGATKAAIKALNRAYDVEESRPFWKRYLMALGLTLLTIAFIVGAFMLLVITQVFGEPLAQALGEEGTFWTVLMLSRWPVATLLLLLAAAFVYWAAPNIDLPWKWVTPGAALFAGGWLLATVGFTHYAASFADYAESYGAMAGVVVLLIWFYLTALALLMGAELNAIIDQRVGEQRLEGQRRARGEQVRRAGRAASR